MVHVVASRQSCFDSSWALGPAGCIWSVAWTTQPMSLNLLPNPEPRHWEIILLFFLFLGPDHVRSDEIGPCSNPILLWKKTKFGVNKMNELERYDQWSLYVDVDWWRFPFVCLAIRHGRMLSFEHDVDFEEVRETVVNVVTNTSCSFTTRSGRNLCF